MGLSEKAQRVVNLQREAAKLPLDSEARIAVYAAACQAFDECSREDANAAMDVIAEDVKREARRG